MAIERWNPGTTYTPQEQYLLGRLRRTRKLFAFLREHRQELLDDAFQDELASMYRDTGAGKEPIVPALMAMAVLLQGYVRTSDAETVEMTLVDLRWQMVLGRLGQAQPAFSQGAFFDFRQRLIESGMDLRLLERTRDLARRTGAFDPRKLPKTLRVAIDSCPLEGAGRVEDTLNLLAHAGRNLVTCAARLLGWTYEQVCREAGIPLLLGSSVKRALDLEWKDADDKQKAIGLLVEQLASLEVWLGLHLPQHSQQSPLWEHLSTLSQLAHQDLEPASEDKGPSIRQGVAPDRRVSVEDPEMRHGRKSKSKRFNGYKRHVASDLDTGLILACAITPANLPEQDAVKDLQADLAHAELVVDELFIDRGYIKAPLVEEVLERGGEVVCRPWTARNGELFSKSDFTLHLGHRTITCPAGQRMHFDLGTVVEFDAEVCDACPMRAQCTEAAPRRGRTVSIAEDEVLQQRLRRLTASPKGRERLRQRVHVEHRLAHVAQRQGRRARFKGVRKNLFDLRRAAAIQNLETIQRRLATDQVAQKAA